MRLILMALVLAVPAFADWEPADDSGERCGRKCRLRDTQTGLVWSRTIVNRVSQRDAQDACAVSAMRLPTLDQYRTAIANGIAKAHRRFGNFGTPEWFFWAAEQGIYVSLEAPALNPFSGLPAVKYKCVLDGGVGGGGNGGGGGGGGDNIVDGVVYPPLTIDQQMDQTGASLGTELQTFEQWVLANPNYPVDLPGVTSQINSDGSGSLSIDMPLPFKEQSDLLTQPAQPPATGRPDPSAQGWDRVYNDNWRLGSGFIGLDLVTSLGANYSGVTSARFMVNGTLFSKSATILEGQATSVRPTANTIRAVAVIRALGKTYTLYDETLQTNASANTPRKALLRETLFRHQSHFAIGPVPVVVTAQVTGEVGHDATQWAANGVDHVGNSYATTSTDPYSSLVGTFHGGAGVTWASAGVYGQVAFVDGVGHGAASGQAAANPQNRSYVCFDIRLKKMRLMSGEAGGYVAWSIPVKQMVERVTGGFCSGGGYLQAWVCTPVRRFLQEVTKITEFRKNQKWYKFAGRNMGDNHVWYDDCPK